LKHNFRTWRRLAKAALLFLLHIRIAQRCQISAYGTLISLNFTSGPCPFLERQIWWMWNWNTKSVKPKRQSGGVWELVS